MFLTHIFLLIKLHEDISGASGATDKPNPYYLPYSKRINQLKQQAILPNSTCIQKHLELQERYFRWVMTSLAKLEG